jgi:hypothetical protein
VRKPLGFALGLALALAASGCGGSKPGTSESSGSSLVRADTLAFVAIDSDLGSSQWKQVDALSKKFPDRDKALAKLKQSLAGQGLDFDRDVKPALGPEVDIAVAAGPTLADFAAVGLTQPKDAGKFKALVQKENAQSGNTIVYRKIGDWYAVSDTQAHIDQVLKGNGKALADESTYKDALGKLPPDALTTAYLNGAQFSKLIRKFIEARGSGLAGASGQLGKLKYLSASLSAENDGLRLKGAAASSDSSGLSGGNYQSKVISGVPADALAFLSFRGGKQIDQLNQQLETNPTFSGALAQIEQALGVRLADILALIRGEDALYVRPGGAIPEFSLVLSTTDQASTLSTLDKLTARLAALAHVKVTSSTEGGHAVKTIDLMRVAVRYAGFGDRILITTGLNGVGAYAGSGSKLSGAAAFKDAKAAAGMPSSNAGFVYVDLKGSIALGESLAGLAGSSLPPQAVKNLRPLRSFVAWAGRSGNASTFDAFLEIK